MTWPMMLRHEVEVDGEVEKIRPGPHSLLVILLLHRGKRIRLEDLIPLMWPNPDDEPEFAYTMVCKYREILVRRHGIEINTLRWHGYLIERPS